MAEPLSGYRPDLSVPHTALLELHANPMSHCSRKVCLALEEVGADFAYRHVDLIETGTFGNLSDAYLAVNPGGLVPTLVEQGHPVYESDRQLEHIASRYPKAGLMGGSEAEQAAIAKWLRQLELSTKDAEAQMDTRLGACIPGLTLPFLAGMIARVPLRRFGLGLRRHRHKERLAAFLAMRVLGPKRFLSLGKPAQIRDDAARYAKAHLASIAQHLSGRRWLAGERYTLADISFTCLLLRVREAGLWGELVGGDAALNDYWNRTTVRPAFAKASAQGFLGPSTRSDLP